MQCDGISTIDMRMRNDDDMIYSIKWLGRHRINPLAKHNFRLLLLGLRPPIPIVYGIILVYKSGMIHDFLETYTEQA